MSAFQPSDVVLESSAGYRCWLAPKAVTHMENQRMTEESFRLPLLQQREIEARIIGPLIRGFAAEIGEQQAIGIVKKVITDLARQGGAELAKNLGEQSLKAFAGALDRWRENDALEIEVLEQSDERLSFNVNRCRYAEMYQALGLADLGGHLSCQRDFALVEGFNPSIKLSRTQTIMEGAKFCDFRFHKEQDDFASGDAETSHRHEPIRDTSP
jgi:hypothetical protein